MGRKPGCGPAALHAAEDPAADHDEKRTERRGREQGADRLAVRHPFSGFRQFGIENTAVDGLDDYHDQARGNKSDDYGDNASERGAHGLSSRSPYNLSGSVDLSYPKSGVDRTSYVIF